MKVFSASKAVSIAAIAAGGLIAAVTALPESAAAMTGSDALATCSARAGCRGGQSSDGSITIEYGGEVIFCPSSSGTCQVLIHPHQTGIRDQVRPGVRPETILGSPRPANPRAGVAASGRPTTTRH